MPLLHNGNDIARCDGIRCASVDAFSYLSVLISIILGLAVTQILQGFRGLLLSRARIRVYWPVVFWAFLLLLVCSQNWWSMFGMRNRQTWTFLQFGIVLLDTVLIYMMAALVFPDLTGSDAIDLKESYYTHRKWFFGISTATIVISVAKDLVLDGRLPEPRNLAFHLLFIITLLIGAITRRETYHKALVVFGTAVFVLYIVVLFAQLRG